MEDISNIIVNYLTHNNSSHKDKTMFINSNMGITKPSNTDIIQIGSTKNTAQAIINKYCLFKRRCNKILCI